MKYWKSRHVLTPWIPNFILLLYFLLIQKGRCYSSLGVGSTCQYDFSFKSSQDDSPYCSMHTCSFILCSSSSRSSSWSLRTPFETWTCLSFVQVASWLSSCLESPTTKAWSLEGLMVPIITNLSCSWVRDSMNSTSLGIFQARAVNLVT